MTNLMPCGTPAAWLRHKRGGEEPCVICVEAQRKYARELARKRRQENPEPQRAAGRRHREKNIEQYRARDRAQWHKLSPTEKYRRRRARLLKAYGLDEAQHAALLLAQEGKCAVCGTADPGAKGWCVDHDHDDSDGVVRGIVCIICNVVLAMMGDDLAGVNRYEWPLGIKYLSETILVTSSRLARIRQEIADAQNPAPNGAGHGQT